MPAVPVVGVTGSNGKSTTTLMTGEILAGAGYEVEVCGKVSQRRFVVQGHALLQRRVCCHPVQGAAVEHEPAEFPRQLVGECALAGTTRPIHGDDRYRCHASSLRVDICRPTPRARASKCGKDVATWSQSRMRISALARSAATAKAMAMRWSWKVRMVPPP